MSEHTHTPGKWHIQKGHSSIVVRDGDGIAICDVWNLSGPENTEANARLIAAAPELLAALECLLDDSHSYESEGHARDHARKVIARARGE